jgi:hypothetical protein
MAVDLKPAGEGGDGGGAQPFVAPETRMAECTARALILGTVLGMVFGASSLYLVLKVGMTVSASIPVAVISLTLFRLWAKLFGGRDATILENNIVQTAGSAGESIAFGVGVTMPAILILGYDLEMTRVMLVALLGAWLGILMMIPLRRALIVQQHDVLKYPEGTACAEVLKAGAGSAQGTGAVAGRGAGGAAIFTGFGVGLVYKTAMSAFKLWKDTPGKIFGAPFNGASVAAEISPELLGVGYVIGTRISCIMAGGGVLSYLVLIPLIKYFGEGAAGIIAPGRTAIKEMGPDEVRSAYILYIGAGAVAAGGIISLGRSRGAVGFRSGGPRDAGQGAADGAGPFDEICGAGLPGAGGGHLRGALAAHECAGRGVDGGVWLPVRHRFVAADRRDWFVLQSDFGHDGGHAHLDMPGLPGGGMERPGLFCDGAVGGGHRVRGGVQRRGDLAGLEDGLPVGRDAEIAADRDFDWGGGVGAGNGAHSVEFELQRHGVCSGGAGGAGLAPARRDGAGRGGEAARPPGARGLGELSCLAKNGRGGRTVLEVPGG